jgi:uncharacterized delta-60 repeat protein
MATGHLSGINASNRLTKRRKQSKFRRNSTLRRDGMIRSATELLESRCMLSAGSLDATFGAAGLAVADVSGPLSAGPTHMVRQSDGKEVVATTVGNDFGLARYNVDGSLDTTFGNGGYVRTDIANGSQDAVAALALSSSGKIIVAGAADNLVGVVRYNADGSLDTTFNGTGKETLDVTNANFGNLNVTGVAVDSSNRIILGGFVQSATDTEFTAVRITSLGGLDTSFNGTGEATASFSTLDASPNALAVDSAGDVVVAGRVGADVAVVRFLSSGVEDTSFNGTGQATFSVPSGPINANAVALDSQGRIVTAGTGVDAVTHNNDFAVMRISNAGTLDHSFNGTGYELNGFTGAQSGANAVTVDGSDNIVAAGDASLGSGSEIAVVALPVNGGLPGAQTQLISLGSGDFTNTSSVTVDASENITVAGTVQDATNITKFAIARIGANGALDPSFNGTGTLAATYIGTQDIGSAKSVLEADGSLLIAFTASQDNLSYLAHFTASGQLDAGFGNGGYQQVGNASFQLAGLAASSGNIYVAGSSAGQIQVLAFTSSGAVNSAFGSGGVAGVSFGTDATFAGAIKVDASGRIVVVGTDSTATNNDFAIARLTAGGQLDSSFNGTGEVSINFGPVLDASNNSVNVDAVANAVAIDGAGRIVVAGSANNANGDENIAVARLNSNGSIDATFGAGGITSTGFGSGNSGFGNAVAIDLAGNVDVGGYVFNTTNSTSSFEIIRLTPAGAPDTSFNGSGQLTLASPGTFATGNDLAIDSNGNITLVGQVDFTSSEIAQFTQSGALNSSFGNGGVVTATSTTTSSSWNSIAIDNSNRIVVGGVSFVSGSGIEAALSRYSNGSTVVVTNASIAAASSVYGGSASLGASISSSSGTVNTGTATFTITDNANNVLATASAPVSNGSANVVVSVAGINVGNYNVLVSYTDSSNNFASSNTTGSLSITRAALKITAANQISVYGAAIPTLTGTITGEVTGDGITANYSTTASPSSNVGSYPITITLVDPHGKLSNYNVTTTPATLTVNKAALSIAANAKTKVYGQANPSLTGTIAGLKNSDNITASYTTTATASSGVGSYPISVSVSDPGGKLSNYTLTVTPGALSVTAATLTITAANATKVYGAAVPALSFSYSGFVNGDTAAAVTTPPTESTMVTIFNNVGSYPITVSGAVAANYAINYVQGTLSVTQAQLYVLVNPTIKWIGQPDPKFTTTDIGFVLGQNASVLGGTLIFATNETTNSPIGIYLVKDSGLTDANYNINYIPGIAIEL